MEANLLVYDVGSTYTKLSAFFLERESLRFLGKSQSPTTVEDIGMGLGMAEASLLRQNIQVAGVPKVLSSSSAAGGLRMVALGYMPRVTAKAAKEVAMGAGARVLEVISCEEPEEYRVQVLREIKPDLILLAGGTDGGDEESLLQNAALVSRAGIRSMVVIAGNVDAQAKVEELLKGRDISCTRVANIMPTIHQLKVEAAREEIHNCFIRQITRAKGLDSLLKTVSGGKVVPTPGAVLMGAELIAKGTHRQKGAGELVVVDIGGATTDVHSVLPSLESLSIEEKGLVLTNEKQVSYRTVEGNLGMRVSATGIVEAVGPQAILHRVGLSGDKLERQLVAYTQFLEKHTEHVPQNPDEETFDTALAISAISIALKRHAGYISQKYDAVTGVVPGTPVGRDLRGVKTVLAVGGVFAHTSPDQQQFIMKQAFRDPGISLLPSQPQFIVDAHYLLYAIGVLSREYPDPTFHLAQEYFQFQSKGDCL